MCTERKILDEFHILYERSNSRRDDHAAIETHRMVLPLQGSIAQAKQISLSSSQSELYETNKHYAGSDITFVALLNPILSFPL